MNALNADVLARLNRLENFILKFNGGEKVFWDLNVPGLHVLTVGYQYMRFAWEQGHLSLLFHSSHNDFFNKTYDILQRAGATADSCPELWDYLRTLEKEALAAADPEAKADINVRLFGFLQALLEHSLYEDYTRRTGQTVTQNQEAFRKLLVAADSFMWYDPQGNVRILAGYPWFDQSWGRDTFISFPGLLLATGRYGDAKNVLRYYAASQRGDGLIPNLIHNDGRREYNSADASLWFIEALHRYYLTAKDASRDSFMMEMLPTVNKVIELYSVKSGLIFMDKDRLVSVPAQSTWMDSVIDGVPVTPRNGKPVEIQALFYNALGVAEFLNREFGDKRVAARYGRLRDNVKEAINARYFPEGRVYPLDVIGGDTHGDAVRPNAVLLLSLSMNDTLLPHARRRQIVEVIERELLTPYGMRTLSPADSRYMGRYHTFAPMAVKDHAYHQGAVWPWLMSHYITAKRRLSPARDLSGISKDIEQNMKSLLLLVEEKNGVPELFSGDEPFTEGGTVTQAWSVGALLELCVIASAAPKIRRISRRDMKGSVSDEIRRVLSAS